MSGRLFRGPLTFKGHTNFLGSVSGIVPDRGNARTFYVDSTSWGSGSDSRQGTDPNYPLATIAKALDLAVSGRNDYIVVLNSWDNDTTTITVEKTGIHIIGINGNNHRAPWCWIKINGDGSDAVFTLKGGDAANVEIAGFTLGADASHPCITTAAGTSTNLIYGWLHHLSFAATGDAAFTAQDGLTGYSGGNGLDGILVEDCVFGYELTRDGIRFINFYDGLIRNNIFEMSAYMGIRQVTGGAARGMPDIIGNYFKQKIPALDKGSAIYVTDGGGGMIAFNQVAENGDGTCDNDPYVDLSTGVADTTLNAWGWNLVGTAKGEPAVT